MFWAPPQDAARLTDALVALGCLGIGTLGGLATAALLVYSPTRLARMTEQGSTAPKTSGIPAELEARWHEYIIVAWIMALGGVAGWLLAVVGASGFDFGFATLGAVAIALCACVALPLATSEGQAESVVVRTLPLVRGIWWLARYPVVLPLVGMIRALRTLLRIPRPSRTPAQIADEIAVALTDSANEHALQEQERGWIENIVEFKDLKVSEAMTPRTDMVAFEADLDLREVVRRVLQAGHSRYPVYEERIDRVIGVFYAKDALALLSVADDHTVKLRDLLRKALFVPETMGVSELLERFKAAKTHLAVVLDEYGGTAGVISIEDILEEIVGNIRDESEQDDDATTIRQIGEERVIELPGWTRIDSVNETLGTGIPEAPEYDTLAGYLFTSHGKIPRAGETIRVADLDFQIMVSDNRRIGRVRVRLPASTATEAS